MLSKTNNCLQKKEYTRPKKAKWPFANSAHSAKEENSYTGQTIQKIDDRTNTHRRCFNDESKRKNSALSMHSFSTHCNEFSLSNFKITLVKKCSSKESIGKSSNIWTNTELGLWASVVKKLGLILWWVSQRCRTFRHFRDRFQRNSLFLIVCIL